MEPRLRAIVDSTFRLRENEGESKVTTLEEAIRRNVKPGIKLQITREAGAAINEITRQYWGTKPSFVLIMSSATGCAMNLIHCGLVKKLITANCSHLYPTPGPSRVIQRAFKEKTMELETWSLCSLQQRLLAGAQGVGFMPSKSIAGSSMAEENSNYFKIIDNPFAEGERIGLVKALNPDVSLVHGLAADSYGNTLVAPPYEESLWGPKASRNGVVVTVEKIVSTDFIRRHSYWAKIPGYLVNSVAVAPFGAHPLGLTSHGIAEALGYGEDHDFMLDYRKATESPDTLDGWIREWVLDCIDHEAYLCKLGAERLLSLKRGAAPDAWEDELPSIEASISQSEEYNPSEMMIVAAARKMRERILKCGYRILQSGAGAVVLPTTMTYYQLLKEGYGLDLVIGSGQLGYAPRPLEPYLFNTPNTPTAKLFTDTIDIYTTIIGGENNRCLSALGAAQIDKFGNINSTKIGSLFLTGAGGGNDAASSASEVIVICRQSRDRFVEMVPYISSPGNRIRMLVSDLGIFEKLGDDKEFTLTEYFPNAEQKVEGVIGNCGWELKVASDVKQSSPPTWEELMILRLLDPKRFFIK